MKRVLSTFYEDLFFWWSEFFDEHLIIIYSCIFLFLDSIGMLVFRIKGENDLTERLLKRLNHRGNLHCVPASLKGKYVIR